MSFSLEFKESALKEWKKLDGGIREQFKKKLAERLGRPHVESARLRGMADCYKIKLKNSGYRLVYQEVSNRKLRVETTWFPERKRGIFRCGKEIKGLRGGVDCYTAQASPRIDAVTTEKNRFRTETR